MARPYCPKRGDIVWLNFHPGKGHEQAGRRPALTLSRDAYNRKVGLAVFCPITTKIKSYPFEVLLPEGMKISGAILSDQAKCLDWRSRESSFCDKVTNDILEDVLHKLSSILMI